MTAALGVGVVVVACLTDPAGACGATPRAIGLRAPLKNSEVGEDEGFLTSSVLPMAKRPPSAVEAAPPLSVEPRPRAGETWKGV